MDENIHANHRKRMKTRFLATGGEGFSNHELLEMVLFGVIPRKNTNPIAHHLIKYFGSLKGVFMADVQELQQVGGIGEQTAVYLKTVFELHKAILKDNDKTCYTTYEQVGELILNRYMYIVEETVMLFLFDKMGRLKKESVVSKGDLDKVLPDMKKLITLASASGVCYAALAHNHPSGRVSPSFSDRGFTYTLRNIFGNIGVTLREHYVIGDDLYAGICKNDYTNEAVK